LYYRVNVVTIKMPSLRDRPGDIPLLAGHFLRRFCKDTGREILGFSDAAMARMQEYQWPGNVRELENAVERAVVLCRRPTIDVDDLPETMQEIPTSRSASAGVSMAAADIIMTAMPLAVALETPEKQIIEAALKRNAWNRQSTAAELDINRTTLYKKMRKYQLDIGESN
jgi:DNA-binding NtrC family response regulator